jgi:chitosanase
METGTLEPDYDNISIFNDGPNDIKQITYGKLQTTEFGNLKDLLNYYLSLEGKYDDIFEKYIDDVGKKQLYKNEEFKKALKDAANNDPAMREAQEWLFEEKYWKPAVKFFVENKFTTPLSMLVIFDSYIHSGSIASFLRRRFNELVPARGGNEKKWITQYLETRHEWLKNHSRPILRKTIYRTKAYIREANKNNWDLNGDFNANGLIVK